MAAAFRLIEGTQDPEILKVLDHFMELAQQGDLRGLAVCSQSSTGFEDMTVAGIYRSNPALGARAAARMSARLAALQHRAGLGTQFVVSLLGPYLLVEGSGTAQLSDHMSLVNMVAAICTATPHRKCVMDLRTVRPSISQAEYEQVGTHAGKKFHRLAKVAVVVAPEMHQRTAERAAQLIGRDIIRTFHCLDTATAWLGSSASSLKRAA